MQELGRRAGPLAPPDSEMQGWVTCKSTEVEFVLVPQNPHLGVRGQVPREPSREPSPLFCSSSHRLLTARVGRPCPGAEGPTQGLFQSCILRGIS